MERLCDDLIVDILTLLGDHNDLARCSLLSRRLYRLHFQVPRVQFMFSLRPHEDPQEIETVLYSKVCSMRENGSTVQELGLKLETEDGPHKSRRFWLLRTDWIEEMAANLVSLSLKTKCCDRADCDLFVFNKCNRSCYFWDAQLWTTVNSCQNLTRLEINGEYSQDLSELHLPKLRQCSLVTTRSMARPDLEAFVRKHTQLVRLNIEGQICPPNAERELEIESESLEHFNVPCEQQLVLKTPKLHTLKVSFNDRNDGFLMNAYPKQLEVLVFEMLPNAVLKTTNAPNRVRELCHLGDIGFASTLSLLPYFPKLEKLVLRGPIQMGEELREPPDSGPRKLKVCLLATEENIEQVEASIKSLSEMFVNWTFEVQQEAETDPRMPSLDRRFRYP